jgi:hypothetical protein
MPLEPVVALWVVVLPFGAVIVNVTLAPETEAPALVTDVTTGTVPGREKLVPETDTLATNEGGVTTVTFAVAEPIAALVDALKSTAYVPAGVPEGAPLPNVMDADWPGLSVTEGAERDVVHPEGSLEARLIEFEGQPELSLFVTDAE